MFSTANAGAAETNEDVKVVQVEKFLIHSNLQPPLEGRLGARTVDSCTRKDAED